MTQKLKSLPLLGLVIASLLTACHQASPTTPPTTPTGLVATAPLPSHVALSWAPSPGATGYRIARGSAPVCEQPLPVLVQTTTYEDSGLQGGCTYYYQVTAFNQRGESGRSAEVSVITLTPPPVGLHASPGDSSVLLEWSPAPSATGYRVYRDTLGQALGATNFLVTGCQFTDVGLVNGIRYFYQVGSVNVSGENIEGNAGVSATPRAQNPSEPPAGPPLGFTATSGNGIILLRWLPVSNASTYNLWRGTTPGHETLWQSGLKGTTFADAGLTNGCPYYYQVSAVNAALASPLCPEVSAVPFLPSAPANLTAQAQSHQVVLTWTSDAPNYAVYRGTASGAETLLDSGLTGHCFTDADLVNGRAYFYKIQCLNAGGTSPFSGEVSATPAGPVAKPWSGTIHFGLPDEASQSCAASIPDLNRPVAFALLRSEGPNLDALAKKYNAIVFALDGFTPFNFGTPKHPVHLDTVSDGHPIAIIDCRWPNLSARRIQAALTAAAQLLPAHPEIKNTGLVLYGFSEGEDNINLATAGPTLLHRVLAAVMLSEIDEDRYNPLTTMDSVPHLFLASGRDDIYSSLNRSLESCADVSHDAYARGLATTQGAPLTVLNNAGAGHGGNPDHPFISLWLDAVLSQRLPASIPISAPVNLPDWQGASSWVAHYDVVTNQAAPWNSGAETVNNVIAPKLTDTDPRPFTWLPGEKAATNWLVYANTGKLTAFGPNYHVPSDIAVIVTKVFHRLALWFDR